MRLKKGEDRDQNANRLLSLSQSFLDCIMKTSLATCPMAIRRVCECLKREVEVKFPSAGVTVVAGFYFLRFVCPAIVTPEVVGIEGMLIGVSGSDWG